MALFKNKTGFFFKNLILALYLKMLFHFKVPETWIVFLKLNFLN